jgi:hypothetical protein
MTSPDPVPPPLGLFAAIVTTEGTTLSATEVTGQALTVDDAADPELEDPELTLEPDDCVAPTITPPTTPPTTSAVPSATHTSHRRGPRGCLDSPTMAPIPAADAPNGPRKRHPVGAIIAQRGSPAILNSRVWPGNPGLKSPAG